MSFVFCVACLGSLTTTVLVSVNLFSISLHHRGEPALHGRQSQGQSGIFQSLGTPAGASELSVLAERLQLFRQWLPLCSDFHLVDLVWHCVCGLAWIVSLLAIPRVNFWCTFLVGLTFKVTSWPIQLLRSPIDI